MGAVEIRGYKEFRRELKALDPQWPKALRTVHKKVADKVASRAQSNASGMGGVHAKYASAARPYATQTAAKIGVLATGRNDGANVAFFGATRKTGWYADPRYFGSPPQHPPWVGAGWDVGDAGVGPYAINPAIASLLPEILDDFEEGVHDVARRAFDS